MTALRISNSAADFAEWIAQTGPIDCPEAIARANRAFADAIACMLAGYMDPATISVLSAVSEDGAGRCTVAGHAGFLSDANAALVNGTSAHALDFDDNFLPAATHASAVLVPALLAAGEKVDAHGDRLLDAYVFGLEAQAWLGRRMMPAHYAAGWHATSTIGAIGAAAACARLYRISSLETASALSLATSMASGSKLQFGTSAKPVHAGLAARAGITAAGLARSGVTAFPEAFCGPWGFVNLFGGRTQESPSEDGILAILSDGLIQKRFPCCASAHRTIDAILSIMEDHRLNGRDVLAVETTIPDSNYRNLRYDAPQDEMQARFSMQYCASVAVLTGDVTLNDFTPSAVGRPEIRTFMENVRVESAGPGSDSGNGIWDWPANTRLFLKDGGIIARDVDQPLGSPAKPLSQSELSAKLRACASRALDEKAVCTLEDFLSDLSNTSARTLGKLLRSGTSALQ